MATPSFKSSPARLARLFLKSRDNWKQRAADKQLALKKMRITVRDLAASREHGRTVAHQQAQQIAQLQAHLAATRKESGLGGV